MANLGNTIINGILRVNGKINSSDVISAPSFVGALTGNADTATKLKTARTINGTSFDGSGNITTTNWGTARNIGIVNSDGTGTAVTVSVNGSGNINLKLPATIKATLTGNADTATKLATARTINGVNFDGTANITVADNTKLPLAGGTMTGTISSALNGTWVQGSTGEKAIIKSTSVGNSHTALWSATSTNGKFQIFKYIDYMGFGYESTTNIDAGTNSLTYGAFFNESGAFYPSQNNAQTLGTLGAKWNNVYATTFTGALSGNATSAGTTAVTDTNPKSGAWYYPTWVSGTSGNLGHRVNNGFCYFTSEGTTSTEGRALLQLGNSVASGTDTDKRGELRIFSSNTGYVDLKYTNCTTNHTILFPEADGTVSLTSHTHSAATTSANGFMSSADKTKLNALHYVRSGTAVPDSSLGENGDIYILLES